MLRNSYQRQAETAIFKLPHFQIFKLTKNIIFDLGGIFMNLDYQLTEKAFIELGVHQFPVMFTQHRVNALFENLETGKIAPDTFYEAFRSETGVSLSNEQIRKAWNAMLLNFPQERLDCLGHIRNRYHVYLFSNTNQIHLEAFRAILQEENGIADFDAFFIKAWYSHELVIRKPYEESFRQVLAMENLAAAETLFIDDTLKNIEGARKAGLQTIHLLPPQTVLDLDL